MAAGEPILVRGPRRAALAHVDPVVRHRDLLAPTAQGRVTAGAEPRILRPAVSGDASVWTDIVNDHAPILVGTLVDTVPEHAIRPDDALKGRAQEPIGS